MNNHDEPSDVLGAGIQPDWWRAVLLGQAVFPVDPDAVYYTGYLRVDRFGIMDASPGLAMLAVAGRSLSAVSFTVQGRMGGLAVEKRTVRMRDILSVRSSWHTWIDVANPPGTDLAPMGAYSASLTLARPLKPFGDEFVLPVDRSDYGGATDVAGHQAQALIKALERCLAGPEGRKPR